MLIIFQLTFKYFMNSDRMGSKVVNHLKMLLSWERLKASLVYSGFYCSYYSGCSILLSFYLSKTSSFKQLVLYEAKRTPGFPYYFRGMIYVLAFILIDIKQNNKIRMSIFLSLLSLLFYFQYYLTISFAIACSCLKRCYSFIFSSG